MKNIIGLISGILVFASAIPYAIRVYQGKIKPNMTSWTIWSIIGFALLLNYKSSGAGANVWPAVFGCLNPIAISLLALRHKSKWEEPTWIDKSCLIFGLVAIVAWIFAHSNKTLSAYNLYISIVADACAAIPTIYLVWRKPEVDRPLMWMLFAIGYGLGALAITEHTFTNYILPMYMFIGSTSIWVPLLLYRVKREVPINEWL